MRQSSLSISAVLALFLAVAAAPVHATDGGGCISANVTGLGEGIGVYVDQFGGGLAAHLASGIPGEGVTLSVLIAPAFCAGEQPIPTGLPSDVGGQQAMPKIPVLP